MTFATKMAEAATKVGAVFHDARNEFYKYDYTSGEAVKGRVQKAISAAGLFVRDAVATPVGEMTGKAAVVHYRITVSDGETSASGEAFGAGTDSGDKAPMKANSAAYKYALIALFCIPLGEDPEADAETDKAASQGSASDSKARAQKTAATPDVVSLDRAKTPEAFRVWCGNHGPAFRELKGAARKECADLIARKAAELEVPRADIKAWLGVAQGAAA